MLVSLPTTKVHLIQFNLTLKSRGIVLSEKGTNLMENESRCFLSNIKVT